MVSKRAVLRTVVPSELRDWVDNRLLSAHIRIVTPMIAGTLLNALVIVLELFGQIPTLHLALFAASSLAAGLHRMWLAEGIARGRRQKRPGKMLFAFRMNCWWLGLNMAVLLALWFPILTPDAKLLLAVCAVTQIASAAYTVRTLPHSALVYVAVQSLGLTIALAREGTFTAFGAIAITLSASALLIRMAYTAHDLFVTRILTDRELAASSRTIKLLLNEYEESGADWLFELDSDNRLHGVSPRFASAAGSTVAALDNRTFDTLFAADSAQSTLVDVLKDRRPLRDLVLSVSHEDGLSRWWSVSGRPCYPSSGDRVAYRGVICDVTTERLAEMRAQRMAHFDTLTGLPNWTRFNQVLRDAIQNRGGADQVALVQFGVDHFKQVNDLYGHEIGDTLLRTLAERSRVLVQSCCRDGTAALVARLGGDEFAVILSGGNARDLAVHLAGMMNDKLSETIAVHGNEFNPTVSIGIAMVPFHADLKQQLQSYAGIALHAAKSAGRGGWTMFEPGMDAAVHEHHTLARDLRHAVSRGEFRLFLQPLVDVASEQVTGYEALLRWQHPVRGLVLPDQFIPITEETGLIVTIGEWVIRSAFSEAAQWLKNETIAINLSPVQLRSPNLLSVIVNALADSGLDPARVEFEITEGVLLNNSAANIEVLNKLHALGVKIALDDFGTGHASLNYLLTFPFDKIKIDRRFISDLETREESRAIVSAVIALANQLGMCTLAEGVEDRVQLDRLKSKGCRMVQGWLFGKALPSEDYHPRSLRPAVQPDTAAVVTAGRLPRIRKNRVPQTYSGRVRA